MSNASVETHALRWTYIRDAVRLAGGAAMCTNMLGPRRQSCKPAMCMRQ